MIVRIVLQLLVPLPLVIGIITLAVVTDSAPLAFVASAFVIAYLLLARTLISDIRRPDSVSST